MPVAVQKQCGVIINKDYPRAIDCLKYTNPAAAKKEKAAKDAQKVSGVILPLRASGQTLRQICDVLNTSGLETERGAKFHPPLVSRMLKTLETVN